MHRSIMRTTLLVSFVVALVALQAGYSTLSTHAGAASPKLLWLNHFDLLPGGPELSTSFRSTSSGVGGGLTALVIESSTTGDVFADGGNKVVHMAVDVPPHLKVTGVRLCYELASSSSFVTQIRLAQVQSPPSSAIVMLDDGTDRTAVGPVCVDSQTTAIDPTNGALLLSLRLNFGAQSDKIVVRGLALHVAPAVSARDTMWLNHFDLLPGGPELSTSFRSTSSGVGGGLTGLVIESSTTGDVFADGGNKVVHMAVDVPPNLKVTGVRLCYELTSSSSFVTQIRLAQVQSPPSSAIVMLDDGTDRTAVGPVCVDSQTTAIDPTNGALLLSLRLNFGATSDKIVVRGLALHVAPAKDCGDVNDSSSVDSIDAALVLQLTAGLVDSLENETSADVNRDGTINVLDALLVLQHAAGLLDHLSC